LKNFSSDVCKSGTCTASSQALTKVTEVEVTPLLWVVNIEDDVNSNKARQIETEEQKQLQQY